MHSHIGPDTFVGRYSEIKDSLAWGDTLINCKLGSAAKVPDSFVLSSLRRSTSAAPQGSLAPVWDMDSLKADADLLWKHFLMNKEG